MLWKIKKMSLEALNTLFNDRDVIMSVVAEHFLYGKAQLRELDVVSDPKHKCNEMITHGLWRFCLHDGTVYLWK